MFYYCCLHTQTHGIKLSSALLYHQWPLTYLVCQSICLSVQMYLQLTRLSMNWLIKKFGVALYWWGIYCKWFGCCLITTSFFVGLCHFAKWNDRKNIHHKYLGSHWKCGECCMQFRVLSDINFLYRWKCTTAHAASCLSTSYRYIFACIF